jgi:hypothetical protein
MRHSFEIHPPHSYFLIAALLFIFASFAARIRLFSRTSSDPALSVLLRDASIIGFGDLLVFRIHRTWFKLTKESKRATLPFIVLTYLGALLLAGTVLVASWGRA